MQRRALLLGAVGAAIFPLLAADETSMAMPFPSSAPQGMPTGQIIKNQTIVTADGRTRTYALWLPTGYSASRTYPLVFLLHGGGGNGPLILEYTQFGPKANAEGFIVCAPTATDKSTNNPEWSNGGVESPAGVDDVAFITQLLAKLKTQLSIDGSKVYSTGISSGAAMSLLLGMSTTGMFAAIAPVAGEIYTNLANTYNPAPLPVCFIHGDADPIQPINGGTNPADGQSLMGEPWTVNYWASRANCLAPVATNFPPTVNDGTSVTKYVYSDAAGKEWVRYFLVHGMGHQWPPTSVCPPGLTCGPTSKNIDATSAVWAFFKAR